MPHLLFPYQKARKTQEAVIAEVSTAIDQEKNLIVHAPTGIGKTAATLPIALEKAIEKNLTVFFLTSRQTQHRIAIDTLKSIKEKKKKEFSVIDLIGKKHMCLQGGIEKLTSTEFLDFCKDLRERGQCLYYSNLKTKEEYSVSTRKTLTVLNNSAEHVEFLIELSKKEQLCPYEIALLVAKRAKVVIADYNYILNPFIRDQFFEKINITLQDCILIFDESHNLPQRSRNIMTASLSSYTLEKAEKEASLDNEAKNYIIHIKTCLEKVASKKLTPDLKEVLVKKQDFVEELEKKQPIQKIVKTLRLFSEHILEEKKHSFVQTILDFLVLWPLQDEGYARILSRGFLKNGKPYLTLSYVCLDPGLLIAPLVKESHSSIFMSGTLTPIEMYKDLFGLDDLTILRTYQSIFPKKNRLNLVVPLTSTIYSKRNDDMYKQIAELCAQYTNRIHGNCVIFFPSYEVRDHVHFYFSELTNKTTFLEYSKLTKQEKSELLEKFKSYKDSGAILLGVSKANFGEGIDLPDLLKCVIVVGIPLDVPNLEIKSLVEYYELKYNRGIDYGYILPAIIKTMQNAGRCIRSEHDKGIIIFLDERYALQKYLTCFPTDWDIKITRDPSKEIEEFFQRDS